MKLLIVKELDNDKIQQFLDCTQHSYDAETVFIDTSVNNDFKDIGGVITIPFEDRKNLKNIIINIAQKANCQVVITFFKHIIPKIGIIEELVEPLKDDNISATYCDYSVDGVPTVQGVPALICRRIEECDGDLYNLTQCRGIVKYIPLDLYDVKR
jgi:hypothetical protein